MIPIVNGMLRTISASYGDRKHCPSATSGPHEAVAGLDRVPRPDEIPSECAHRASGGTDALTVCMRAYGLNPHPELEGMRRQDPKPSCKFCCKFSVPLAGHSPPWASVFLSVSWSC